MAKAKSKRPKVVKPGPLAVTRCRELAEELLAMMRDHIDGEAAMRRWIELRLELNQMVSHAEQLVSLGLLPTEAAEALVEFCGFWPTGYYFDRIDPAKRLLSGPLESFLTLTKPTSLRPNKLPFCPECKVGRGKVIHTETTSRSRVQYRKCGSCGHNFQDVTKLSSA